MAYGIKIPKLGMSMKEAALVEWKTNEGDWVEKGQIVLVIESEKTTWEVEALSSGYLHILKPADPDGKVPVGEVIGLLAETEVELKTLQTESGPPEKNIAAPGDEQLKSVPAPPPEPAARQGRIKASPVARKIAEEKKIDLAAVTGTGPGGRITKEDVLKAAEISEKTPPEAAAVSVPAADEDGQGRRLMTTVLLKSGMRRAIARHMQQSLAVSAQLTVMGEIDMTEIKRLRADLLKQEEKLGTRITYTDIIILAVVQALKKHPIINSSLIENEIRVWENINIGIAVALQSADDPLGMGGGLIVPVIKDADQKKLADISRELKILVQKARAGTLTPDEVTGGTFTITNLGGSGGSYGFGTPIINQPESAILGPGPITDRPVVRESEIVVRPIMTYSFTFDHRVIDGAPASAFMMTLAEFLENPLLLLC